MSLRSLAELFPSHSSAAHSESVWHNFFICMMIQLKLSSKKPTKHDKKLLLLFCIVNETESAVSLMYAADFKYLWKQAKERRKLSPVKRFIWFSRRSGLVCVWRTFRSRLVTTIWSHFSDSHHYRIKN